MIISFIWLLLRIGAAKTEGKEYNSSVPIITGVSAMCSSDGMTASIDFDRPFNGKIYSMDYATVHDCIYYNTLHMDTVLFSIPVHRCGTKLSRTTRNIVDQMANRVYVQMDKYMQTAADKQFNFVCQLGEGRANSSSGASSERRYSPPVMRDSYVQSIQGHPIKPKEVHVAASADSYRFGNWPIPGATPFSPSMLPAAVLPKPIAPHYAQSPVAAISSLGASKTVGAVQQRNEQIRFGEYAQSPASSYPVRPPIQHSPPLGPPISPQTDRYINSPVGGPSPSRSDPVKADVRIPPVEKKMNSYVQPPWSSPNQNNRPFGPAVNAIQMHSDRLSDVYEHNAIGNGIAPTRIYQTIGLGMTDPHQVSPTTVAAPTWNRLTTVVGPSADNSYPTVPTEAAADIILAKTRPNANTVTSKLYKEEGPRIGVEFTHDNSISEETVNVSSGTPLTASQERLATSNDVQLEIQKGVGPFSSRVIGPVRIGDNITLVVRSPTHMTEPNSYDMFVHSCFATDGPGATKIDLIDKNGCVIRPEFISPLNRIRDKNLQIYYFIIEAFKFPGPEDVYFSCSIDVTPLRNATDICGASRRLRRNSDHPVDEVQLFDGVRVELDEQFSRTAKLEEEDHLYCTTTLVFTIIVVLFVILFLLTVVSAYLAISFYTQLLSIRIRTNSYDTAKI